MLDEFDRTKGDAKARVRREILSRADALLSPADADMLPRFHRYLSSKEASEVELGLALVGPVKARSSIPLVKKATEFPNNVLVQGRALEVLGSFGDVSVLPVLREAIKNDDLAVNAVRALRPLAKHQEVRALILELLRQPKRVTYAKEVAPAAGIDLTTVDLAVAQNSFYWPAAGVEIDFPENWPQTESDDYDCRFENSELSAWFGLKLFARPKKRSARALLGEITKGLGLGKIRPTKGSEVAPVHLEAIGADEGEAAAFETRHDEVVRVVVVVKEERGCAVVGRAPKSHAAAFHEVFETMWPTLRLLKPQNWTFRPIGSGQVTLEID